MKNQQQEFLEEFNQAFARSDTDFILRHVTDNIKWTVQGDFTIQGKEAFTNELQKMESNDPFELTINNIISHGRSAAVDGTVTTPDGKIFVFCDVYKFNGLKNPMITEMVSYVVEMKQKVYPTINLNNKSNREKMNETYVETKGTELTFSRIFNAPRELVFETYSTCEHLRNWWGPRAWPLSYCKIDFRERGKWHFCMSGPNEGDESWGIAVYKEINKPEKIVYIDSFSDENGNVNEEMPTFQITVTFDSIGDKTEITTLSRVDNKEELEKLVEMGMIEGFTETWDRLEEHLEMIQ